MNNMKKTIKLTENDLIRIVENVLSEQLNLSQNFKTGQNLGQKMGQGARQAVNTAVNKGVQNVKQAAGQVLQGGKEIVVKIGNTTFTVLVYGAAMVFLLGKGVYKVGQAVGNAILKFLSATGKATVSAAKSVGSATMTGLKNAGIAVEKGAQFVGQQLTSLKDNAVGVVKWMINKFKQFGAIAWGKVLLAASAVKEWGGALMSWIKQQYGSIANQLGVAWDDAVSGAKKIGQKVASTVGNAVNTVKNTASNIANNVSNAAGNAWGAVQGFLSEFFERFYGFESNDTLSIVSESRKYNGLTIL